MTTSCSYTPDRSTLPTDIVEPEDAQQKAQLLSELADKETIVNIPFYINGHTVIFTSDGTISIDGIIYQCTSVHARGVQYSTKSTLESDSGNITIDDNGVHFSDHLRCASLSEEDLGEVIASLAKSESPETQVVTPVDVKFMNLPIAGEVTCTLDFSCKSEDNNATP